MEKSIEDIDDVVVDNINFTLCPIHNPVNHDSIELPSPSQKQIDL